MTIDRIGPTDPLNKINKSNKVQKPEVTANPDSINVSKSAMDSAELIKAANIAKGAPDIRADRVAEVKAKLQNPNYINDAVINSVAEKIMDDFGI